VEYFRKTRQIKKTDVLVFICMCFLCCVVAAWLSGNIVGHINEVILCRAGLIQRWVTVHGIPSWYLMKTLRTTQPDQPSV